MKVKLGSIPFLFFFLSRQRFSGFGSTYITKEDCPYVTLHGNLIQSILSLNEAEEEEGEMGAR